MQSEPDQDVRPTTGLARLTPVTLAVWGLVLLTAWIARPFLAALVWAVTLAILAAPLQARIGRLIGSRGVAAALTVAIAAVILIVPAIGVIGTLLAEAVQRFDPVLSSTPFDVWSDVAARHPQLAPAVARVREWIDPATLFGLVETTLRSWSKALLQGSISGTFTAVLTVYFAFFLLKDQDRWRAALRRFSPLAPADHARLARRIVDAVHATVFGTATVAALQGGLGGAMFWMLGLSDALFWGVIMGLLAVVPFLGAFVVWAPTAVALALGGNYAMALLLVGWGVIVVGLVDNFVYPILIGRRLQLQPILAFVATFGGLLMFGPHGIILGPVALVVLQVLVQLRETGPEAG